MSEIESSTPHEIPAQAGTPPTKRDSFTSKLRRLLRYAWCQRSGWNIWKFPPMTGTNAARVHIIYLICSLFGQRAV